MEDNKLVVKYPAGSGDIAPVINKRRRKPNGRRKLHQCDECLYQSNRSFNIERHRVRIHSKRINKECCGKTFHTKADWYYHVEDFHPSLRERSYISKEKYQILGSKSSVKSSRYTRHHESYLYRFCATKMRTRVHKIYSSSSSNCKRTSLRMKNKLERKCLLMIRELNDIGSVGYDLDDLPLYYRLKYPQLRSGSSYQSLEDYQLPIPDPRQQTELNLLVKIDFSSDFTDGFHYSDLINSNKTNSDNYKSLDDSGFNETLTIPEVHHEEVIEHVVEEETQEMIWENKTNDNYFTEFKIQSVKQKGGSNVVVSQIKNYGANLDFLPPKKRILRQWETNVISSSVRHRKTKLKSNKRVLGTSNENEENINPNKGKDKDNGYKIVVRKVVIMEEKSEEIYWDAEERHRAFLNSFDFDRLKTL